MEKFSDRRERGFRVESSFVMDGWRVVNICTQENAKKKERMKTRNTGCTGTAAVIMRKARHVFLSYQGIHDASIDSADSLVHLFLFFLFVFKNKRSYDIQRKFHVNTWILFVLDADKFTISTIPFVCFSRVISTSLFICFWGFFFTDRPKGEKSIENLFPYLFFY